MPGNLIFIILFGLASALAQCSEVEDLLKPLSDESAEVREKGELNLKAYIERHNTDILRIGKKLLDQKVRLDAEALERINRILKSYSEIASNEDMDTKVSVWTSESTTTIDGFPVMAPIITNGEMFMFYRKHAMHDSMDSFTKLDFSKYLLMGISITHGADDRSLPKPNYDKLVVLKKPVCIRNFEASEVQMQCGIAVDKELRMTSRQETCGIGYKIARTDLPLTVNFNSEITSTKLTVRYAEQKVEWADFEKVIAGKNIFALRSLAEQCTPAVSTDNRIKFLSGSYAIDPLLPYVYFTHMARNHPVAFLEDYAYWVKNVPAGNVVGKLFSEALELAKSTPK